MTNTATGIIRALNSGIKHIATKRFTLRYPEEKLKFVGDGYQFDPYYRGFRQHAGVSFDQSSVLKRCGDGLC